MFNKRKIEALNHQVFIDMEKIKCKDCNNYMYNFGGEKLCKIVFNIPETNEVIAILRNPYFLNKNSNCIYFHKYGWFRKTKIYELIEFIKELNREKFS